MGNQQAYICRLIHLRSANPDHQQLDVAGKQNALLHQSIDNHRSVLRQILQFRLIHAIHCWLSSGTLYWLPVVLTHCHVGVRYVYTDFPLHSVFQQSVSPTLKLLVGYLKAQNQWLQKAYGRYHTIPDKVQNQSPCLHDLVQESRQFWLVLVTISCVMLGW